MATTTIPSADELSRELSALSTTSSNQSISNNNADSDSSESISQHDTVMSASSSRPTTAGMSSVTTPGVSSRESTGVRRQNSGNDESEYESVSRENSVYSQTIREGTINDDKVKDNSGDKRQSSAASSYGREQTSRISHRDNGDNYDDYDDDFEVDDSGSSSQSSSRQQSFVSRPNESESDGESNDAVADDGGPKIEKENSVLIEKDGKFELVEEKDLTSDQRSALGLTTIARGKQKPNALDVPKTRVRKSSNPEFAHLKSEYAMSEQQKEMRSRRISVKQMLRQEEKEKSKQEEEEKKSAADKSFKQWLAQKKETNPAEKKPTSATHRKKRNTIIPPTTTAWEENAVAERKSEEDAKQQELSDRAFKQWLDEKQGQSKSERRMEELRLADEAQNYVVRDRKQCDKAFKDWLKKKKMERQGTPSSQTTRKKPQHHGTSATVRTATPPKTNGINTTSANKKKSLAPIYAPSLHQEEEKKRRPRSSVRSMESGGDKGDGDNAKRRPKTSKIRITDNYGYRHPASIDDFISRSGKQ